MTTQYTPTLKLALPVTGELSGTWGDTVNDNITSMIEQAIAGLSTINTWTGNAHTLTTANGTTSESRCAMLVAAAGGGSPTAAAEIICPAAAKLYVLQNTTAFAVTLKTSAGTGIAVAAGNTAFLFCNGTNVNACVTTIVDGRVTGNLTVDGNATINGNTTLGNATSDTITATARFNTDLVPSTDNARDLGSVANSWKDLYIDGTAYLALVDINGGTIDGVSIGASTAVTLINVDNLRLDGNTLSSTDTNGNVVIAPNGTGDVQLDADTVRVGDAAAAATLTSNGAGALTITTGGAADLTLSTNSGTTSGTITIANGANGNITLTPDGTGDVIVSADRTQLGDLNTDTTLTTNGTGSLNLSTNNGTNSGTIQIAQGVNGNITLTPNGTGSVSVPKLVVSTATATRVPYISTGGLIVDSANLTFDGTTLSAGGLSTTGFSTQVKTVTLGNSNFNGTAIFAPGTPAKLFLGTGVVTDVTSAAASTNATGAIASLAITPIAASNASVTYTNAATLYIAGAPSASTNVTITNPYALYVAAGGAYFGGVLIVDGAIDFNNTTESTSVTTGAVVIDGGVGIAKSLFVGGNATIAKNTAASFLRLQSLAPYAFPGDFSIQAGGQSTPALTITDNTAAQERLNFLTGETVFNQPGADQDFRIESDTEPNMFFLDAGNNRIGFKTNTPVGYLTVGTAYDQFLTFQDQRTNTTGTFDSYMAWQTFGTTPLLLGLTHNDFSNTNRRFFIKFASDNVPTYQERMGINYLETVFNESSVDVDFRVESDAQSHMLFVDASANTASINSSTNFANSKLFVEGGMTANYADTIALRYNVSGETNNYYKGMSGTDLNLSSARGLHLFNFDQDSDLGVNIWNGYPGSAGRRLLATFSLGEIVFNEASADVDFRVESDANTHMLFVDASANGVNIGGFDTIQGDLNVIKNTGDTNVSTTSIYITTGQTYGTSANRKNLDLVFQGYRDGVGNGGGTKARLRAQELTGDDRSGSLVIDVLDNNGDLQRVVDMFSGSVTFNEGGIDQDFRVESDTQTHMLFVDAGTNTVQINTNNIGFGKLNVFAASGVNQTGVGLPGNSQGSPFNVKVIRHVASAGGSTKLVLPFLSQGSLNSTTVCRVMGHNAQFNTRVPRGFDFTFAVGHLNFLENLEVWGTGGNYSSIAINGMNVEVTFASAYGNAGGETGGMFITLEYMSNNPSYSIQPDSIVMA